MIVASPKLVARESPITPSAISELPCLLFPDDGYAQRWKFRNPRGAVREFEPRGRVVAADGMVLRALAVEGEGLALLPRWLCAEAIAAGTLVDVFPGYDVTATEFDAVISVLYASRSYLPIKVRVFVSFLTDLFRNGPPWEAALR